MELLPCPFCGGEALPTAHLTYNWFAPVCGRCNARGPSVKIERDSDPQEMRNLMNQADENWNHRASPASAPELREQVEKLTKERDTEIARNRPLQSLIKSTEETKSFLLKKSEENKEAVKQLDSERQANALLTEELAALAAQNEKLKDALRTVVDDSEECTDFDGWTAMLLSLDAYHIASTCLEETGIRARRNHG